MGTPPGAPPVPQAVSSVGGGAWWWQSAQHLGATTPLADLWGHPVRNWGSLPGSQLADCVALSGVG